MMRTGIGIIFIASVFVGCVGSKMSELEQQRIQQNCEMVSTEWDNIAIGSNLVIRVDRDPSWFATRIVRFVPDDHVKKVLGQLREPSYTRFLEVSASLEDVAFGDKRINELAQEEQRMIRELWSKTLNAIFASDAFDADTNLLGRAIQGGELHVNYVLVGRYNTAETGHVDGAKIVVTDSRGIVVAKLRKRKTLLYPYRFIDVVRKTDKYLF